VKGWGSDRWWERKWGSTACDEVMCAGWGEPGEWTGWGWGNEKEERRTTLSLVSNQEKVNGSVGISLKELGEGVRCRNVWNFARRTPSPPAIPTLMYGRYRYVYIVVVWLADGMHRESSGGADWSQYACCPAVRRVFRITRLHVGENQFYAETTWPRDSSILSIENGICYQYGDLLPDENIPVVCRSNFW